MLAFLIFVVFLLGLLCGVILTVAIAAKIAYDDKEKAHKTDRQVERDNLAAESKNGPILT